MRASALLSIAAVALLAAGGAPARAGDAPEAPTATAAPAAPTATAKPEDNESGPNFALPGDLPGEARDRYEKGLRLYGEARKTGQSEKIEAALKEFKKARDAVPKLAPACYYLGILYQWTKEFEKARQVLQAACDLNPAFHQAIVELGDAYMWLKKPEKAFEEYDRAIAVRPDYGHAYTMRAFARLKAGEFEKALSDLESAKKHGDADPVLEYAHLIAKREVDGPGWATTYVRETKNYRVLTPVSQELADDIGKHAELIYLTYTKIFPKIAKEKRKFPVVVHASKEDYHASGGPPGAGGHYEPLLRKLVLFQYPSDENTKLVLYHEGFHQFLHDYLEDAPQWMNEGLGDFFGPSKYVALKNRSGKIVQERMDFRPNPWRLRYIQGAIQAGRIRPWRQLMLMTQQEMYDPQWAGIHYAQAWSIIYFLVRAGAPEGSPAGPYFKFLKSYFTALRRGDGQESAFEAAFGRADLTRLESEWKKYVLGLRPEE